MGWICPTQCIEKAQTKYPDIHFIVGNAENFTFEEPFDTVFSNAALHWMMNAENVLSCVWNSLNPNGRFVAEFGGKGNLKRSLRRLAKYCPKIMVWMPHL
ncbi:methyltransferase domain-containing protein [Paenibacillus sp. A3]|uniref:class I SAM-dependent methyltransferase n=1 Tax=Paenibacillus sp. A3 TaxID=1337054 RepID=UPI00307BC045